SPTARLLQHSRLFALPRPLPAPSVEALTQAVPQSDTATLPYPTHQAIATQPASRSRGDWGLKRPLPSKANASTSHVRIYAQDTRQHVTDFGSAADHTETQAKWRQMGVPFLAQKTRSMDQSRQHWSAFDSEVDNTEASDGATVQRWKYDGPWLGGMQAGEFDEFITDLTVKRMDEWRDFVALHMVEQHIQKAKEAARADGREIGPQQESRLREEARPNEESLMAYEQQLRKGFQTDGLSSELTKLIARYLDLPSVAVDVESVNQDAMGSQLYKILGDIASDTSSIAPQSTHPSAGMLYTRTNAVMENHPVHGPQLYPSPVEARVLRPRQMAQGPSYQASLGVGGVVTSDSVSAATSNARDRSGKPDPAAATDPDLPGGNKVWVHPLTATINHSGRIKLNVVRADKEAVAVKTGDVELIHEIRA
ncbi:hypothetical protein K470DRAFT_207666, partial [Piedraia hortae CBS 480.64]